MGPAKCVGGLGSGCQAREGILNLILADFSKFSGIIIYGSEPQRGRRMQRW